jgi:hypothetical protein
MASIKALSDRFQIFVDHVMGRPSVGGKQSEGAQCGK